MGVVLGEAADPEEAVERAAPLIAVDGPELGPAQRQVAVGAHPGFVDLDVERASSSPITAPMPASSAAYNRSNAGILRLLINDINAA